MEKEKVTVVDSISSHSAVRSIGTTILTVVGGGLAIVVGIGIWMVWRWLPVVGYVAIGAAILVLVCGVVNALVFTARYALQETYYDIGEFGTRVKSLFGRPVLLAPMAQTTASNAAKIAKTEVQVAIPTLFDLLAIGEIHYGMTDMILGYQEGGQIVRGRWPNTFAVAGKGRSGKTRRVVFMLVQALMAGAHITICDPHYNKHDSLTKELEPLAPWLHFAGTIEEIMAVSDEYLAEMQHREDTKVDDDFIWPPRLIVYDEWSKLMTQIEEDDSEKLMEIVTAASQEYAGFNGYACIIGQNWVAEACGGTKIRRALHAVFVHRIDTDYAKYLIKIRKWYSQSEQLSTGHCFYQDLEGKVTKLVMPFVEDRAGVKVAELLRQVAPPVEPERIKQHASKGKTTGPLVLPHVSLSPETRKFSEYELDNFVESEAVNAVKQLPKPRESGESLTIEGESGEEEALYTPEKETKIVLAAFDIAQSGQRVTRSAIKTKLGWTNKQWNIIKAVCDKHSIALQGGE